ncbi:MAG TPA: murein L,D-transpeptidase catalytic domain family protein [Thermoanaerobaculia bacterium]|nr:murein L,D-transpeptidase catalytic domain family protein [Thermoanaerobaculia bacterium]
MLDRKNNLGRRLPVLLLGLLALIPTLSGANPAPAPALAGSAGIPGNPDGLSPQVLRAALDAVAAARARGVSGRGDRLTVIDYSLPSTTPRLWVLDLARGRVLFHELVAHGAGSGENYATQFSNVVDSRETSLGLFLTAGTYEGGNGYSLKLRGLDPGVNDRAEQRNIVVHGAPYVSAGFASQHGRLGRSWGCPALPLAEARPVIDAIKGGSFVFSYSASPGLPADMPRAGTVAKASTGSRSRSAAGAGVSEPARTTARR